MDGGLSANDLPEGIASPRDSHKILDALGERGWPPREIEGFAYRNWAEFFGRKARSQSLQEVQREREAKGR